MKQQERTGRLKSHVLANKCRAALVKVAVFKDGVWQCHRGGETIVLGNDVRRAMSAYSMNTRVCRTTFNFPKQSGFTLNETMMLAEFGYCPSEKERQRSERRTIG